MYRIRLDRAARLTSRAQGMFDLWEMQWIAPHLRKRECAETMMAALARKRDNCIHCIVIPHLQHTRSSVLYVRLVDMPEPMSHLYVPIASLIAHSSPVPPFDDLEMMDNLVVERNTRIESLQREQSARE